MKRMAWEAYGNCAAALVGNPGGRWGPGHPDFPYLILVSQGGAPGALGDPGNPVWKSLPKML